MANFRHAVAASSTLWLLACAADTRPLAAAWEVLDERCSEEAAQLHLPLASIRERLAAVPSEIPGKRKVAEELLAVEATLRAFDTELLTARNAAQVAIAQKQPEVLEALLTAVPPALEKRMTRLKESANQLEGRIALLEQASRAEQEANAQAQAIVEQAEAARSAQLSRIAKHGGEVTLEDLRFAAGSAEVSPEPKTSASLRSLVAFAKTCATLTFDVVVHAPSAVSAQRDQHLPVLRASFLHARLLQEGVRPAAIRRVQGRPVQGEGFVTVQVIRRCP
ncbi:MAG: hypothetical protein ACKVPX_13070 [Myxococcaceae bacterium]